MTQVCVPLMVEDHSEALRDAILAAELGADLVEFRVDVFFEDRSDEEKGSVEMLQDRIDRVLDLVEVSPLPCIVTCRPHWEGGEYHGDDDERVALFEALGTSDTPPAYIDVELATYTRSKNIRQKINLAVNHPKQVRAVTTRLILSAHDFEGRPSDLTRKIIEMQDEPACSIVKIAYRARSIRDNLELFEILADRQKPTIALCMGEFGIMSRILAPKFGGFLTFASLRDESTTAPGQITIDELINLYRFRSITPTTKVYGIIGWPVTQSMSPMVHNAGFEKIGWDGVYVPMPVEGSYESFKATVLSMIDSQLDFAGASVTIPHKEHLGQLFGSNGLFTNESDHNSSNHLDILSSNTLIRELQHVNDNWILSDNQPTGVDTDTEAIRHSTAGGHRVVIVGTGGAAKAAMRAFSDHRIYIVSRDIVKSQTLADQYNSTRQEQTERFATAHTLQNFPTDTVDLYVNCTPVGMKDGPNPDGISIPLNQLGALAAETIVFDTVYNPIETPLIKFAKSIGVQTVDGVTMFVKQAEMQFGLFIGDEDIHVSGIEDLFDRLVREKLSS
ncbi:MAG: type I 3-dehydroquinate dehydratase [Phycisphaerales bacterium]|nr:type I 3-dehydroquinate dehydratase [Phycisphaerales bacterium]